MAIQNSISNAIKGSIINGGGPPAFLDNKSFEFDGTTSYFDGNSVTYTELDGATKAAFSFWIKPTSSTFRTIFAVGTTATAGEAQILCFADASNRIRVNITDTTNTMSTDIDALQPNYWNHVFIAINFSGPSGIYIDGINKTNTVNIGGLSAFATSKGDFYLGEDSNSYQGKFLGLINEFALWSGGDYINSFGILFNEGLPRDLNNLPLNSIGQATPPPTTWFRCGESSTWDGSKWTMADVNGGYNLQSIGIAGPPTQPSSDVPLYNNKSFVFDGISDRIIMGNVLNLADDGSDPFSISFWVKSQNGSGVQRFVSKITGSSDGYGIYQNGSIIYMLIGSYLNNCIFNSYNFVPLNNNTWHHLVWTYDGSQDASGMKLHINGGTNVLTGGLTNLPINNVVTTAEFRIGSNQNGKMDEVSYFNFALTQENITSIYNNGIPNNISSLNPLGWWRIGEDALYNSGTGLWSFPDNGSGGNNGSNLTFPESARVSDVPT